MILESLDYHQNLKRAIKNTIALLLDGADEDLVILINKFLFKYLKFPFIVIFILYDAKLFT